MSDIEREAFEAHHYIPEGVIWNEKLRVYRCGSSPGVNHPINENWETWQEAVAWQAARAQDAEPVGEVGMVNQGGTGTFTWTGYKAPGPGDTIYTRTPASVPKAGNRRSAKCNHFWSSHSHSKGLECVSCGMEKPDDSDTTPPQEQ